MITAQILTPLGSGAIAVIGIDGVGSRNLISKLFHPVSRKSLPSTLKPGIRFGNFGGEQGDEILLVTRAEQSFEIHAHGGSLVVDWILKLLTDNGALLGDPVDGAWPDPDAARLLPFAKTVRCASILLDQAKGAYRQAVAAPNENTWKILRLNARLGSRLITPWNVVIAGRPNAGKSSLMNALAGFARSVVSEIPGTTRDTVSLELAFDGWPIRLTDTAGLRDSTDELESEGIRRAEQQLGDADLIIWLADLEAEEPLLGFEMIAEVHREKTLVVYNKTDCFPGLSFPGPGISATTGEGIDELIENIVAFLIPEPPNPGEPVPYSPELATRWSTAATF